MANRRQLWFEIAVVFSLSLGASALYSIVALIAKLTAETTLAQQQTTINRSLSEREWLDFTYQFLGFALGLAPVALVVFLIYKESGKLRESFSSLGWQQPGRLSDLSRGFLLTAAIGIPGIGLYLSSLALGINSQVVPADLNKYWWTAPILLLLALKAALLEEFLVVGYLFNRLQLLGWSSNRIIAVSALFRASYHLYQGFGGFIGALVMGFIFGWVYKKYGRLQILVFAHFLLDAFAFVGYSLLVPQLNQLLAG